MAGSESAIDVLLTPGRLARWAVRRAERDDAVLRATWRLFVEHGGPVTLEALVAAMPDRPADSVRAAARGLDARDLLVLAGDAIRVAYPFDAGPTPFAVTLAPGRDRYACCAIDALGMAPMVGVPTVLRGRCHRSAVPIVLAVDPEGGPDLGVQDGPAGGVWDGWRVWIEAGQWGGDRLSGGL